MLKISDLIVGAFGVNRAQWGLVTDVAKDLVGNNVPLQLFAQNGVGWWMNTISG